MSTAGSDRSQTTDIPRAQQQLFDAPGGARASKSDLPVPSEIKTTLDQKKYEDLWRKWGELAYTQYVSAPLFWVPSEVAVDPNLIADYVFPGSISSTYTHVEYITIAR